MVFNKLRSNKKNKIKCHKYIRFMIICLLFADYYFNKEISKFSANLNFIKECDKIEDYLKLCNNKLIALKNVKKYKHPKISIVSPIFNRGKYLLRFIKSLQNQNFKSIEIILIDDFSKDDTKSLIQKYQESDDRILLIENKKNKGTFASRNIGALKSRGQYIMFPDPDDILSNDCIRYFYNFAKKNDYELIRFYIYTGKRKINLDQHVKPLTSKPIYQPELSTYLFYAQKILKQIDYNVSNKFIKREALIRVLNCIKNDLFIYMTTFEDGVLNYFFYRNSKSFYLKKKIGYYYIKNRDSITLRSFNISDIKCIFFHLKFVFKYSKNTKYEKNMSNVLFRRIAIRKNIREKVLLIKDNFNFYLDIIEEFLDNEFITNNNKKYLIQTRKNLIEAQNNKQN